MKKNLLLLSVLTVALSSTGAMAQPYSYNDCAEDHIALISTLMIDQGIVSVPPVFDYCLFSFDIFSLKGTSAGAEITVYVDLNTRMLEFYNKRLDLVGVERRYTGRLCLDMHSYMKYASVTRNGSETCER